jgi:MFS transporter, SP family, galactose:H+ symporter
VTQGFSSAPVAEGPLTEAHEDGLRRVWRWGAVIALGGFLFGYDTGVISGALLFIKKAFHLDAFQQGSLVSVLLLGAMGGALSAGRLGSRLGRRRTLGLEGVVFLVGTAIAVASNGYAMLLLARIVLGWGVGAASATVPVYLSEISPPKTRGRILTMNQLLITIGILVAYLVNVVFSASSDWRAMFACGAVPALGLVLGSLLVPESPAWELGHGYVERARVTIASVSGSARADEVIANSETGTERLDQEALARGTGWRALLQIPIRPALTVGLTLAAIQQFGGINTIIYYAPTIMQKTGLSASSSIAYSVAIGVINFAMTVVAIRLVDRAGRRRLLLVSLFGMCVTLALLGLTFVTSLASALSLIAMVTYICAFAVGLGPVFWVLIGEIFPARVKSVGSAAATTVNWLSNFVVSLVFLSIANAIGQGETFWLFAVVCASGLWFVRRFVPETRDREFAEIDEDLKARFGRPEARVVTPPE